MSVLDKLARAETSSDLRHYDTPCAVDVLKAAGIAAMYAPIHIELYRIKYLNDYSQISACKSIFTRWAYRAMLNRGLEPSGASRLGSQTLQAWVDDTCKGCAGQKFQINKGTPTLSERVCGHCNGSGKPPIPGGPVGEVMKDVASRANDAISSINRRIREKLA